MYKLLDIKQLKLTTGKHSVQRASLCRREVRCCNMHAKL